MFFSAYHIHVEHDSSFEVATVKFRGWRYGVASSPRSDKWAIVIKVGRPCSQVVGGLICAFRSYFLNQNNNKSSLHKVPRLERRFLLWLPGIKVVSILDGDGVKSRLLERDAARLLNTASLSCELETAAVDITVWMSYLISLFSITSQRRSHCQESYVPRCTYTTRKELFHTHERVQTVAHEGECAMHNGLTDLNQQPWRPI